MSYRNYLICDTEASRPTNEEEGMLCYCKDTDIVYKWTGSVWTSMAGGSSAWGAITGTLSSQTDLQTALDAKSGTSHNHTGVYAPVLGTDDNYVTDAEKVKITNLSGTNTGDQTVIPNATLATMLTKTYKGNTTASTATPTDVPVATLKTDLTLVKADVGLGSVDNTTDAGKPVSTAQQTALDLKANLTSPSLITPNIGVATGTSLAVTGAITSSGGGIGYVAGAGGTVTQATSRTTTVVLNKLCGNITMFSAAQAANALVTFTLTNSFIAANDYLLVQHISATNGGAWVFSTVCGAGSATISVANSTALSITSATPLRFTIIKGVTS